MKKYLPIAILLLFCVNVFSQNNELSFRRYSYTKSKGYKIKIKESEDKIFIEIKLADSISKKLHNDKSYIKLKKRRSKLTSDNKAQDIELIKSMALEFDELRDKYTFYKTDTLVLDKELFSKYYNAFNQILSSPTDIILENKKDKRIVLDGYNITFIMKTKKHQDILNLNSPNEESHPILIKFLKNTFEMYRNEKKNDFLNREYTFGL